MESDLLQITQAAKWATSYINKKVSDSNITYLVQYAKIEKYLDERGNLLVKQDDLKNYYDEAVKKKEKKWKEKLGEDLNWNLSFDNLREKDTTKHVHRLHPYKGKFIPQLVEYFLDDHVDNYKKSVFFKEGDVLLDPFMGSGTTLIQSSELGMHSIGIDVSEFNCLIAKMKSTDYIPFEIRYKLEGALNKTINYSNKSFNNDNDIELKKQIELFNKQHFYDVNFKQKIKNNDIDEGDFAQKKLELFLIENRDMLNPPEYCQKCDPRQSVEGRTFDDVRGIATKMTDSAEFKREINSNDNSSKFINKWFSNRIRKELTFYLKIIDEMKETDLKTVMKVILSRTARSCRATTHFDLATLKEPQIGPYYCRKHKKICFPLNTIIKHLRRYTYDTVNRIIEYLSLKKDVFISIIHGDSRTVNIFKEIKANDPEYHNILKDQKIAGIFTSPPYVGQIDYHEQHAYAYELLKIQRNDEKEIGPLYKGKGQKAREEYVEGISNVLLNISKFIKDDGHFFIVANDKFGLYPLIAEKSKLYIVNQFKRPVLNRTERDRHPYAEIIFHMKKSKQISGLQL